MTMKKKMKNLHNYLFGDQLKWKITHIIMDNGNSVKDMDADNKFGVTDPNTKVIGVKTWQMEEED